MTKTTFHTEQATQPIPVVSITRETTEQRMRRLKATADATGRHLLHVYLEDEKKRQGKGQR